MKILMVIKDLYVGGVQKSCVNFVNLLADHGDEIDLVLFNKNGPLLEQISKKVNIIEANKSLLPFSVSQSEAKKMGIKFYLKRTITALLCKIFGNKQPLKKALKKQDTLTKEYDISIAFQSSVGKKSIAVGCSEFVLQKTKAKQKWTFVHGDYAKSGLNEPYANYLFAQFDKILCVSQSCAEIMKNENSELSDKVDYLYNVCNAEEIIEKSKLKIEDTNDTNIKLITVSRLSEEKGHIRLLEQLKKLKEEGFKFNYTIVGDGKQRTVIENYIKQNNMEKEVVLLGNKVNPYCYIKNADLFILPSFHEAAPMVYAESFLCRVPVLTTKTASAKELVADNGFMCENNAESIYQALKFVLTNQQEIVNKKKQLLNYAYDNEAIYNKIVDFKNNKKPRVVIVMTNLCMGGMSRSLINFVENLKLYANIDIALFRDDGDMMNQFPKDVKLIVPKGYMDVFVENRKDCKKLGFKKYLFRNLMSIYAKIFKSNKGFVKFACKHSQKLIGYDVAISYNGVVPNGNPSVGSAEYVLNNIMAKKKFAITHDDYLPHHYKPHAVKLYKQFDKVFAVSSSCKNRIIEHVPELTDKMDYLYNFCNDEELKNKLNTTVDLNKTFNIVTVARLSPEKGVLRALKVVKILKDKGYKFTYNIVGSGGEENNIKNFIAKNNLTDCVKLLGYQSNPYPYIKASDLMLCTSYRESFGISLVESMLLGVPVLSTKTTSAEEVVGEYGFICENTDEDIYNKLNCILSNIQVVEEKKNLLKSYTFDNEKIIQKFLNLCEE